MFENIIRWTIIIWRESVGLQIPVNFVINENCQYLYNTDNQRDINNIAIVTESYLFCMAADAASLIFNFVKVLMRWSQYIYFLKMLWSVCHRLNYGEVCINVTGTIDVRLALFWICRTRVNIIICAIYCIKMLG